MSKKNTLYSTTPVEIGLDLVSQFKINEPHLIVKNRRVKLGNG